MSAPYVEPDLSWYCSNCGTKHWPGDICWSIEEFMERQESRSDGEPRPGEEGEGHDGQGKVRQAGEQHEGTPG